jgi:hypothetical protein
MVTIHRSTTDNVNYELLYAVLVDIIAKEEKKESEQNILSDKS